MSKYSTGKPQRIPIGVIIIIAMGTGAADDVEVPVPLLLDDGACKVGVGQIVVLEGAELVVTSHVVLDVARLLHGLVVILGNGTLTKEVEIYQQSKTLFHI